jgi:ribosomal protein S15P/S13E
MAIDEERAFEKLGALEVQVANLSIRIETLAERSSDEHRKVHDIVVATSEAMRNLTREVAEMKPLTEDYRERRAEKRGEEKYKNWLYGFVASVGGLMVFLLGKLWDLIAARPHP